MGKCISCGTETNNSYIFHAGEYVSSYSSGDQTVEQYRILETFNYSSQIINTTSNTTSMRSSGRYVHKALKTGEIIEFIY